MSDEYTNEISRGDAAALIPEEAAQAIWSTAPESSIIMSQMPTTQLQDAATGKTHVVVEDTLPEAYFRDGEDGLSENTGMSWDKVQCIIAEIVVDIIIKKTTMADSAFDIWGFCVPKVSEAIGRRFDRGVLLKEGAPADWPTGLLDQIDDKGQVFDYSVLNGGGKDLYDIEFGVGGMMDKLQRAGYMADGHVAALEMMAKYEGLRGSDGRPIFNDDPKAEGQFLLKGRRMAFPRNGAVDPSRLLQLSGEWKYLAWCKRQDITMEIFRSGTIQRGNQVIHNLNQQGKVCLQFTARLGWCLPNPVNAVTNDRALALPFVYLKP